MNVARTTGFAALARWLFVEPGRGRPRVGWRLVVHTALIGIGLVFAEWVGRSDAPVDGRLLAVPLRTVLVLGATAFAARVLDERRLTALTGPIDRVFVRELVFGLGLGTMLVVAVAGIESGAGLARYSPSTMVEPAPWGRLGAAMGFFVAVALEEELWFRGYLLTNLVEAFATRLGETRARTAALVVSSIVFGLAHAFNPGANWLSTMNVAVGGALLGVTFAKNGRLGTALGLHFSWNATQSALDMPVSGLCVVDDVLVHREPSGPAWLVGDAFGPEGGVLGLGAMVVGIFACVLREARRAPRTEPMRRDVDAARET